MSKKDQPSWRKSSFSGDGDCLEWLMSADGVRVRNSKRPDDVELYFTNVAWAAFVAELKAGKMDPGPETGSGA